MHLQILLQFPRESSNETENCSANFTQIRVKFTGYTIYKNKKEKNRNKNEREISEKRPCRALLCGPAGCASRRARAGMGFADRRMIQRQSEGVMKWHWACSILSSGIMHKNTRFGEYDFVRYFFRKLLLFRYIWCIIRVERYPDGGIRHAIHCVRNWAEPVRVDLKTQRTVPCVGSMALRDGSMWSSTPTDSEVRPLRDRCVP